MVKKITKQPTKEKAPRLGRKAMMAGILSHFAGLPFESFNYKQIAHVMGALDKAAKNMVNDILEDLALTGDLIALRRGKYQINPEKLAEITRVMPFVTGKVDMKQTGKAYVITKELEEDVFIDSNNTGRAMHGDTVKVSLFPKRKNHKIEGQIIEIITRAKTRFVGTIEKNPKFAFLIPDNPNMPTDIFIPLSDLKNAKQGDKVVVRMTEWPEHSKNPFGEVEEVLGRPGENEVEMKAILADHDFPLSFSKKVEQEAQKVKNEVLANEIKKRRDYRDVLTFTIDPVDAKDYDDAISYKKLENGNHEVGVHIADVSHYVQPGGAIDEEAYSRGTSIYLVDRVIPMLPEALSNFVCSLRPDEEKLCFAAIFEMDDDAKILNEWFGKTVIRSNRRFAYEDVQKIIEEKTGEMADEIAILYQLSSKLRDDRFKKGSINFKSEEVKFYLDEKGKPTGVYVKIQKEANWLIEDFMLLANRKVAERIGRKRGTTEPKTFVYRIHDQPSPEKLSQFMQFIGKFGYKLRVTSAIGLAKSFNELFTEVSGRGEENLIETLAIRTMMKARYSTHNVGHYGLAFPFYTHFTSPIRRYPDLMVHRLLERYLEKKPSVDEADYEEMCEHSSDMEKKAEEAERASVKYKQAEYMADKIGQEFDGLISGVSKYGIFVVIKENKCEGMIRLGSLSDDFYYLDEENYRVIGHQSGNEYKLGDPIRIRVKNSDIFKKQLDFEPASVAKKEVFRKAQDWKKSRKR
jgi:ribonuclease R